MRQSLAALGLLVILAGGVQPAYGQTASLAGKWKLNTEESDDPQAKLEAVTSAAPTVNTGYSTSRRNPVGAGRIAGEQRGEMGGGGAKSLPGADFARIMKPAALITIEQNDSLLTIRDNQGIPQLLYLDGRKFEEPTGGPEPKQTVAKWKDGKLTVERKLGGIGAIRETFTLDSEKKRLVVEAKLSSPDLGKTLEIRRVYDAGS
jgi:hypothetical protein